MNHCIFSGDTVTLNRGIDAGEVNTGAEDAFVLFLNTGVQLTIENSDGHGLVGRWTSADQSICDVRVWAGFDQFDHDHQVCEDVFDEHQSNAIEWST